MLLKLKIVIKFKVVIKRKKIKVVIKSKKIQVVIKSKKSCY